MHTEKINAPIHVSSAHAAARRRDFAGRAFGFGVASTQRGRGVRVVNTSTTTATTADCTSTDLEPRSCAAPWAVAPDARAPLGEHG